jgi:hypothetical protein
MAIAALMTIIGIVLAFVEAQGYSKVSFVSSNKIYVFSDI